MFVFKLVWSNKLEKKERSTIFTNDEYFLQLIMCDGNNVILKQNLVEVKCLLTEVSSWCCWRWRGDDDVDACRIDVDGAAMVQRAVDARRIDVDGAAMVQRAVDAHRNQRSSNPKLRNLSKTWKTAINKWKLIILVYALKGCYHNNLMLILI